MPEPGSVGRWVASHASRSAGAGSSTTSSRSDSRPERAAVGPQRAGVAELELLGDVGHHAVVRGRRRAQHGDARGEPLEHLLNPPVVGPEVVTPVGDAVRLVDHQQPHPLGEQRQHAGPELRVVEPLGTDQQQVDGVALEQLLDLGPPLAVGRVDRVRADAEPLRRRDLVAHQRQQRRDDQRRARTLLAQQRRRDEVDGGLAPARALDAQHARAILDQVGHGLALVLAEAGSGSRQALEQFLHHIDSRTGGG